ncbi:MAG: hypothetical protein D8M59_10320 [Planctomycetes bacterium]|nr:hypothetical protein [Planctomycetota bacterium]NOG55238.1 hypothetical protein [Planctomycetota bacterium]
MRRVRNPRGRLDDLHSLGTNPLLSMVVALIVIAFTVSTVQAGTFHVYDGESIQEMVIDCQDGDEIIVHPGVYQESIDFLGKAIWLHSNDGPAVTTIDASRRLHVVRCTSGEGPDTILEGFTITGGEADGSGDNGHGGGMLNVASSPTVRDCIFEGNWAFYGGGMLNRAGSAPEITNCTFRQNIANQFGGGMENYDGASPTITDCTFGNNQADYGGGMLNSTESSPTIMSCLFESNRANLRGGGMENYTSSHPTLNKCVFKGNTAVEFGGGIYNSDSSDPALSECTFTSNSAHDGGGMMNLAGSSPSVLNCSFDRNIATEYGGAMENLSNCHPTLTSCIFTGNVAEYGGALLNNTKCSPLITNCMFVNNMAYFRGGAIDNYEYCNPTLVNCTFTGNTANEYGGAIYNYYDSNPSVTNCIFWGDTPDEIVNVDFCDPVVTWCDVMGGYDGIGNIDACPVFVNPLAGDFRLHRLSPCADAGCNDAVPYYVTIDLDGHPRFVDDAGVPDTGYGTSPIVDIGAYERQENSMSGFTFTVPGDFATIQEAILYCSHGDEIIVAPGTYQEAIDFAGREVWLHSSDGAAVTTIDGVGAYHVVQCINNEGPSAILEGFTITGGNATGINNDGMGGGMLNISASPTVRDCSFTGNTAQYGGGMLNGAESSPSITNCVFDDNSAAIHGGGMENLDHSHPTILDCRFADNAAEYGGGMLNNAASAPFITNCLFEGNSATFGGGAIDNCFGSSPTLTNCTFSANTAVEMGGGIYNFDGSNPTITNCIFWADAPDEIVNRSSTPIVTWSDIERGYMGEGNIDADPLFVDPVNGNYRFLMGTPCIDAANNKAVPPEITFDLDGNPRFKNDRGLRDTGSGSSPIVDMGCFEFQGTSLWKVKPDGR